MPRDTAPVAAAFVNLPAVVIALPCARPGIWLAAADPNTSPKLNLPPRIPCAIALITAEPAA